MIIKEQFDALALSILEEIKKANTVLLHCHPSPDPDSVGSVLAMKFALEGLGKKVTAIQGDSQIPKAFMHFPGAETIVPKNFHEVDLSEFDLFIALDSSTDGISRLPNKEIKFPESLKIINIDHHRTNAGFGNIHLVDTSYPANCLILVDLFKVWGIKIDENIAPNLFIGAYTDTGGFKYEGVKPETFVTVGELAKHIKSIPDLIAQMENTTSAGFLAYQGAALESITTYFGKTFALATVPYSFIQEKGLTEEDIAPSRISSFLRSVPEWKFVACASESEPGVVKFSFRTANANVYDVSKLAQELGGGGHKAAAGLTLRMPFDEAIAKVVETAKVLYNL